MLVIVLEKTGAIDTYTKNHFSVLEADYLILQHWKQLCTIKKFLQPFYQATLETQGDSTTIDKMLWTMDILIQHFEDALVSKLYLKLNNTNIV
jgi:hypothetical protein